jgi:Putative methyltransferase
VLAQRLELVQAQIRTALAERETTRVVSICAGEARDLIGVLEETRAPVTGRLVELDPANADAARAGLAAAGCAGVEVVTGDAAVTDAYGGAVPADLVLACGVFGNIADDDVRRTVAALPQLCARGATVVWTRHRKPPDLTPAIRAWFAEAGFEELGFESIEGGREEEWIASVGTCRWPYDAVPLERGVRLFTFVR